MKQQFNEIANLLGFSEMKKKILVNEDALFELSSYK